MDLEVRSGELVALLGPSGCGKSTTLRMIAGLEDVTDGDILIGGRSVLGLRPQERNVGVAFENYGLYPPLTVAANLAFGLDARRLGRARERRARIHDVARRIGLLDVLDARPASLSSGQKQRVALGRAIIRAPDVLLLDEPLSRLDAAQRDLTRRELRRLQRELGYTTVLVTHDQEEALSLADRVVVMDEGRVRQVGTPDEVYDDPADVFVAGFVGEPAMNLLPGVLEGGGPVWLSPHVAVPTDIRGAAGDVVLGVRPEDVILVGPDADRSGGVADAVAHVLVVEDLLECTLLTVELPGVERRLVVQTGPGLRAVPGQAVSVAFHRLRTYVFDAKTGERLR